MMTIEQIAEKLGVSKTEAYGLVRCFERTGVLKSEGKAPRADHQRGRSSHLYRFNDEIVSQAAGLLATLIEDQTAAAAETPAEAAPANQAELAFEETVTVLDQSAAV